MARDANKKTLQWYKFITVLHLTMVKKQKVIIVLPFKFIDYNSKNVIDILTLLKYK